MPNRVETEKPPLLADPSAVHGGVIHAESEEASTSIPVCDIQLGMAGYDHDVKTFEQAVKQINTMKAMPTPPEQKRSRPSGCIR